MRQEKLSKVALTVSKEGDICICITSLWEVMFLAFPTAQETALVFGKSKRDTIHVMKAPLRSPGATRVIVALERGMEKADGYRMRILQFTFYLSRGL
jgi:hypothetical protein